MKFVTVKDTPNGEFVEEVWEASPVVILRRTRVNVNGEVVKEWDQGFFIGAFKDPAEVREFLEAGNRRFI